MALKVGSKAPDFVLRGGDGKEFRLSQTWAGKPGIIYFYPKDFTPGCTAEACAFRDHYQELAQWGIPVVGISRDSEAEHARFARSYQLPFTLLSDPKGQVCAQYDARIPVLNITKRVTYLLDSNHIIVAVVENFFAAETHVKEMLAELRSQMQTQAS